ncbi:hypothetical protein PI124_g7558 [Phytophthora idaei]|nr:hypothetical protein PI125_g14257 [Phytophthora idaei]KAG3247763.1 hypothetical protein PI124_g7558 [Phytophthora idaei]
MRFSHVLVVIAAAFLATTDALSTSTETRAAQVASQDGPSQRLLRNHYTTAEDDEDSEAREGTGCREDETNMGSWNNC